MKLLLPTLALAALLLPLAARADDDAAAAAAAPPIVLVMPERGQVEVSLLHELDRAYARATAYLATFPRPAPDALPPAPDAFWAPTPDGPAPSPDAFLPLLVGRPLPPPFSRRYEIAAALAWALDRAGEEWVFIDDGAPPVEWRKALIHTLLVEQKVTPDGTGHWTDDPDDFRATIAALQALTRASGTSPDLPPSWLQESKTRFHSLENGLKPSSILWKNR